MSKALNQIKPGTTCTIKDTGQSGTLEKIFYYPTKYEVKVDQKNKRGWNSIYKF